MGRRHRRTNAGRQPNMDMSPMIDLVFLLLIFFMIVSQRITYQKDPNVTIPVATHSQVPKEVAGRVVINIYADGTVKDVSGSRTLSPAAITAIMEKTRAENQNTRLHLRADQNTPHRHVQAVMDASARGGVSNVIFSTYVTDK